MATAGSVCRLWMLQPEGALRMAPRYQWIIDEDSPQNQA
jgi:hypothetical protein